MKKISFKLKKIFRFLITPFHTLKTFFRPLRENWKFGIVFFIGILLVVPLIILSLINFSEFKVNFFNRNAGFDLKYLLGIWISIIGIYVSIRIYFELQNKVHSLNGFIRIVYEIINKANADHEVFIVLPTAFIGYLNYLKGKNYAYAKFERKLKKLNNLRIAFLNTEIDSFPTIDENNIETDETIGKMASFLQKIEKNNLLIRFHEDEFGDGKNKKYRYKYFAHLINFMKDLKDSQESKKNSIDFIIQNKIDAEFDVIVANVTKKESFIGVVDVLSQVDIIYSGERIVSDNLSKNIEILYNSYIKK